MKVLRVALPPLQNLTQHSELEYAWLERNGQVGQAGVGTLMQLGQAARSQAVECFLHPLDSVLTSMDLPPLSPARISAAVDCAAQALMLGRSDQMHVAHSRRNDSGQVQLSWLSSVDLERLGSLLEQSRLTLRGLYPAPYRLALPPAGQISANVEDGHLLLRHGAEQGAVEPLIEERLAELLASGDGLYWIGDGAPAEVLEHHSSALRWSGLAPKWGLHGGLNARSKTHQGWGRAVVCSALAIAVWVIGLNLYAAREASQGQQLKAQMSQRVKQAFPQLPVVLNPLQQARQQLAARKDGGGDDPAQLFNRLVLQAGSGMPFMTGSVERLVFADGTLQLMLLDEARRGGGDKAWQDTLAQAGISAVADDGGWTLRPAGEVSSTSTESDDNSGAEDE